MVKNLFSIEIFLSKSKMFSQQFQHLIEFLPTGLLRKIKISRILFEDFLKIANCHGFFAYVFDKFVSFEELRRAPCMQTSWFFNFFLQYFCEKEFNNFDIWKSSLKISKNRKFWIKNCNLSLLFCENYWKLLLRPTAEPHGSTARRAPL